MHAVVLSFASGARSPSRRRKRRDARAHRRACVTGIAIAVVAAPWSALADAPTEGTTPPAPVGETAPPEPLPFTVTTLAGFGVGTRSLHGSFGITLSSQSLGRLRSHGTRSFVGYGASAFLRAYAPATQIGCGADIDGSPRVCPTSVSAGPTFRLGNVVERGIGTKFGVFDDRFELAFTPFAGSEPLRAPGRTTFAWGARVAASATFATLFWRVAEGNLTGRDSAMLAIAILPLLVLNRVEVYAEPIVVDGQPYVSFGLGSGFGF